MKIGIDARMFSTQFTGIGRYTYELIHNLLKRDQENEYSIFLRKSEYLKTHFTQSNVKKVLADFPHYSLKEQLIFPRILRRAKLDLIHYTHFNAPFFSKKPSIVTIHDLTLSFFPGKKMNSKMYRFGYNAVLKKILKKSLYIIAVSQNTKNDLIEHFSIPEKKIHVIHEGVDNSFYKKISDTDLAVTREKFGLHSPFLLYTGVWRSHKNLTGLIKAFSFLKKEYKLDCDLVITGKENPLYSEEIFDTVNKNGLSDFVHFVGMVSDSELIHLYNLASLYIFPSFYEGFGLPPLEAMACGTPVVCSNSSSLPEICGNAAHFFDPYDPRDMAKNIAQAYLSPELQNSLIREGNDNLKRFSWNGMAEKTLNIYKNAYHGFFS